MSCSFLFEITTQMRTTWGTFLNAQSFDWIIYVVWVWGALGNFARTIIFCILKRKVLHISEKMSGVVLMCELTLNSKNKKILTASLFVWFFNPFMGLVACYGTSVEITGKLAGSVLLVPCGFPGFHSGCQAWPLAIVLSHQLYSFYFN